MPCNTRLSILPWSSKPSLVIVWVHLHLWKLLLQKALKCCWKTHVLSWNHRTSFLLFCGKPCLTMAFHIAMQAEPFPSQQDDNILRVFLVCLSQHLIFREISAIPTACRKEQQRCAYYLYYSRAQLWCCNSVTEILGKYRQRKLE